MIVVQNDFCEFLLFFGDFSLSFRQYVYLLLMKSYITNYAVLSLVHNNMDSSSCITKCQQAFI